MHWDWATFWIGVAVGAFAMPSLGFMFFLVALGYGGKT